ncbi:MAG: RagB/SusD family nutrient uptake outer membrane protein [Clostridiales bacterium]|jgi:hypothetical protein|nr:RagB/SusD family nutrient uptake outer membrane protein [Clostridiales bacterium]
MKYINKTGLILIILSIVCSCADLDTFPEGGIITNDQVKENSEKDPTRANAKVAGMYGILGLQHCIYGEAANRHDDFGYPAICLSQDLNGPDMSCIDDGFNWFTVSSDFSDRTENYANPYMRFAIFYKQIAAANDLIKSIDEDTEHPTLKIHRAQAKAVRAFDYLSLVPYYQFKYVGNEDKLGVPLMTEVASDDNPRAKLKDIYELIIKDLNYAIEKLEGYERKSKGEVDQQVAYGIRARAHLYMEKWTEAAADADKALQGYKPYSVADISKPGFIDATDPNWMWAILIGPDKVPYVYPTWPSKLSSFAGYGYTTGVGAYKTINKLLFSLIPATDVRKGWWVDDKLHSSNLSTVEWNGVKGDAVARLVIGGTKVPFLQYTNVKFGQYGGPGGTTNAGDWCIMRAEEMILIKAEGLAMSGGNGNKVLEDFIKTYRDPEYICKPASGKELQDEIWIQRRIELWGEGFAMADIMRLQKNIVRFVKGDKDTNIPITFRFNIAYNDEWLLLRFPLQEINSNPDVKQNEGSKRPEAEDGEDLRDGINYKL